MTEKESSFRVMRIGVCFAKFVVCSIEKTILLNLILLYYVESFHLWSRTHSYMSFCKSITKKKARKIRAPTLAW